MRAIPVAAVLLIAAGSRMPPASSSAAVFTDVAAQSGITFRHVASKTSVKFLPETMGGGVAVFDADGDGRLDLFFTNGAAISVETTSARPPAKHEPRFWNRLYRNRGGLAFEDATERSGLAGSRYDFGAAAGDYDNDGDIDLHVTGLGGNTLFRNDGTGVFTDVTKASGAAVPGWSSSAAFLDYDHDGRLDLFVGRYLQWTWETNPVCLSADGATRAYCHPRQFAPLASVLLRNNGDGTFSDASATSGIGAHRGKALGVAIHDYDRDGLIDLFVANDSMQQFLFRNTGRGTFAEVALEAGVAYDDDGRSYAGMGVDVEDYDDDGWPDVFVTALSLERYALYRGDGRGRFEYASHVSGIGRWTLQNSGWGTKFVDFDNDGRRDLFVAQSHVLDTVSRTRQGFDYLQPPLMLRNQGSTFSDVSASLGPAFLQPAAGRGAAFGDLDDDGDLDIVVSNLDAVPLVLRNDAATGNHWLTIALHGRRSNRDGIGAVVTVVDDSGRSQSGVCSTSSSYQSASDRRVHFGLGGVKTVRQVEVRWPGGALQIVRDVVADRIVDITEPATSAAR
jgi:hypothetical protein